MALFDFPWFKHSLWFFTNFFFYKNIVWKLNVKTSRGGGFNSEDKLSLHKNLLQQNVVWFSRTPSSFCSEFICGLLQRFLNSLKKPSSNKARHRSLKKVNWFKRMNEANVLVDYPLSERVGSPNKLAIWQIIWCYTTLQPDDATQVQTALHTWMDTVLGWTLMSTGGVRRDVIHETPPTYRGNWEWG